MSDQEIIPPEKLSSHHCVPCEGGIAPLKREEFSIYLPQVGDWRVREDDREIEKEFVFLDFKKAIAFINKVAVIAEEEGHHPDIRLHNYKKVTITLSTHAINGLSVNDFVLAVKIDKILE